MEAKSKCCFNCRHYRPQKIDDGMYGHCCFPATPEEVGDQTLPVTLRTLANQSCAMFSIEAVQFKPLTDIPE